MVGPLCLLLNVSSINYTIYVWKTNKTCRKSYSRNHLIDIEKRKGINVRTEWLEVKIIMCLQAEWRLRISTIKMKLNMLVWQQLGIIKSFLPIVRSPRLITFYTLYPLPTHWWWLLSWYSWTLLTCCYSDWLYNHFMHTGRSALSIFLRWDTHYGFDICITRPIFKMSILSEAQVQTLPV